MKNIKVEWCENFIKATFKKLPEWATGIEVNCFFEAAEKSGLYIKGTYGSPMSCALENLTGVRTITGVDGNFAYNAFYLK